MQFFRNRLNFPARGDDTLIVHAVGFTCLKPNRQHYLGNASMTFRHIQPITSSAMLWLLVALFALPTSFVPLCPCVTAAIDEGCSCVCDCETAESDTCRICCDTLTQTSSREFTLTLPVCGCDSKCPCRCQCEQRNDREAVIEDRDSHRDPVVFSHSVTCSLRPRAIIPSNDCIDRSGMMLVLSSQQHCATLSRFLL